MDHLLLCGELICPCLGTPFSHTLTHDTGAYTLTVRNKVCPQALPERLLHPLADAHEQRAAGELPEQAPAPLMKQKTYKELGSPTAQAEELAEGRVLLTEDELGRERAVRERQRLEAAER